MLGITLNLGKDYIDKNVWPSAVHIPEKENNTTGCMSRLLN